MELLEFYEQAEIYFSRSFWLYRKYNRKLNFSKCSAGSLFVILLRDHHY